MVKYELSPARTALIVVDMQRFFLRDGWVDDAAGVLHRVNRLAAGARAAGALVIQTAHVFRPDGSNVGTYAGIAPQVAEAGLLNDGTETAAFHPDLDVAPTDIVLKKPRYNCFIGTDLDLLLRGNGIDTVVIAGVASHVCVEGTAREAAERDYRTVLAKDATATYPLGDLVGLGPSTAAELHRATCNFVAFTLGEVADVDSIRERLAGHTSAARAAAATSYDGSITR
ncbi:cysteine hydrolase [Actinomadura graeca]|uniref:Cysteine hydrolase n=1 Tax=Actinomadura graeca TaxID=2750812 RepID=A0ABX8QWI5_9ACTN|nr:isochorismatase family cysteine hydrolase [Actinomadura graeca]QXJ22549.1 cysteine hydrolase [Actinomadura graeca]